MPLYEYKCDACERLVEVLQAFSARQKRKCESCGGRLRKLVSRSGFRLKGTGWYATDYGSPLKPKADDSSDDASPAPKDDSKSSKKKDKKAKTSPS